MRTHRPRLFAKLSCHLVAAVVLLVLMGAAAQAQSGPPPGAGPPPTIDPKGATHDRQYSEARLRGSETGAELSKASQQRLAAAIEQTRQDFKRIQIIRNEMVDALVAKKPHDYKKIADQAGEINKRADRLRTFMMQPQPEEKARKERSDLTAGQMEESLVRLCNLIFSFTQNPVVKNPGLVDVRQSTKAGGDLLDIIELSGHVQKSAERLRASK